MFCNTISLLLLIAAHWTAAYLGTTAKNQKELVEQLRNGGSIKSDEVADVMNRVDRKFFADVSPYEDCPMPIGYRATISAPHMHAFALEALKEHLRRGKRALDVGSGSGYLTVCMSLMLGKNGTTVGIEHIQELVNDAKQNVLKDKSLKDVRVKFIVGDGRLGFPEDGPYDAIHVGAAAARIPEALLQQLNNGGRMVIPVGEPYSNQDMMVIDKDSKGSITKTVAAGVIYVPLTDKNKQLMKR